MNKKLFFGLFAAASMLFATSCSNDELNAVQSENEAQVKFSLGLEGGVSTRAISDGLSAKKLICAIYDANETLLDEVVINDSAVDGNGQYVNTNAFQSGLTDIVNVTLAKGQTYTIAFWAQNGGCSAYNTTDLKNVQVNYTSASNNHEFRDAFFAAKTFTVAGNAEIDVTLNRPFAQINVGVTEADWTAAVQSGIEIQKSSVVIKNAANAINLLTGAVSGEEEVTYALAAIPAKFTTPEDLKVDHNADGDTDDAGETYKYLSMSYILVADGSANGSAKANLESLAFTFNPASGENIIFKNGLNNVPVQRNWRTNILGKLLTGDVKFNITIDKNYLGDNNITPGEEAVVGTAALETAMGNNTSAEPFTYNVQGLSESDNTSVTIPTTFVSEEVTLNFTDIKDGSTLNITGTTFANTIVIKVPTDVTIQTLNLNSPNAHVIWAQGGCTNANVSTSGSTFVIASGAKIENLTVNTGNISIEAEAEVENLAAGENNEKPIIVYLDENAEMPEVEEGTTVIQAKEESTTGVYTMTLTEDLDLGAATLTLNQNTIIEGNGKTLTYSGAGRAIEMPSVIENETYLDVTIKNLTINCTSGYCERAINYNANGKLVLEKVTVKGNITYALNFPGKSNGATVTITDSKITGLIALNVWGENMTINVTGSELTSVDNTEVENYAAISLNNNTTNVAEGTVITVDGGKIIATDENGNPSTAVRNSTKTGKVNISTSTEVTGNIMNPVALVFYEGATQFYSSFTLASAIKTAIETNAKEVCLITDITTTEAIKVNGNVTINLNGFDIIGTDNTSKNFGLIDIQAGSEVNIINNSSEISKLTLTATENRGWNAYSSVISNQRSELTVGENVLVEHLGGTDMAYGIDNLTNTGAEHAKATIEGATIKSSYRAIRQFLNSTAAGVNNILHVKSGIVEGANKSIWVQNANEKANPGMLTVEADAELKGDVMLSGSSATVWPVEASIAKAALAGDSEVTFSKVPAGFELVETDGIYSIRKYEVVSTVADLQTALKSDAKNIYFAAPAGELETIDFYSNTNGKKNLKIVGTEGTKIKFANLQVRASLFDELTIENCEILRMPDKSWGMIVFGSSDNANGVYTISNCTFIGVGTQGIYINENVSGATYNIVDCTFDGDFGGEGAVTVQNNENVNHTVNVKGCTFNKIPDTSHKVYLLYAYNGWTLNTDLPTNDVYWKANQQ